MSDASELLALCERLHGFDPANWIYSPKDESCEYWCDFSPYEYPVMRGDELGVMRKPECIGPIFVWIDSMDFRFTFTVDMHHWHCAAIRNLSNWYASSACPVTALLKLVVALYECDAIKAEVVE